MAKKTIDAMKYEPTKKKQYNKKPVIHIKITDGKGNTDMKPLNDYKETKKMHKLEIKQLKNDIHRHKLLIKQAKIMYKLSK